MLALPWYRFITGFRVQDPERFPEHFEAATGTSAVAEAEAIIAQFQANRDAGRGIRPPQGADEGG